ncbi:uncharacterized protein LOC115588352 [Sparus aurata]|uniref:uncharacterized protein LOC115588352 n=1 Tax=Sparus aurata TaxID=8175 RepID=UPI0011C0F310|nr:uncharacterized protein LOC115588352 [Sparus aurata]
MSLTAAVSGFVVFLLSVSVIQGQDDWGVTYSSTEICALKGSTVDMSCTYTYPSTVKRVENRFWFTKESNGVYTDLRTDPQYSGRVQYICVNNNCTLRITDLRESDSAEYKFRFIIEQEGGKYSGLPGVTLSVTEPLKLQVHRQHSNTYLSCVSSCDDQTSFIWFKNGEKVPENNRYYYPDVVGHADEYTCAVKGYEKFPSPPVYAPKLHVAKG